MSSTCSSVLMSLLTGIVVAYSSGMARYWFHN